MIFSLERVPLKSSARTGRTMLTVSEGRWGWGGGAAHALTRQKSTGTARDADAAFLSTKKNQQEPKEPKRRWQRGYIHI